MSSKNKNNFTFFLSSSHASHFFLLTDYLELTVLCWIGVERGSHIFLFLILKEKLSLLPLRMILLVGFTVWLLLFLYIHSMPNLLMLFYYEQVLNIVKWFLCVCWDDHRILFLLIWNNALVDLLMLSHSCIPG